MKPRRILVLATLLVLGGLSYSGWRYVAVRNEQACNACARPIHYHSKAVALVNAKRTVYCCPACALTEHRQSGRPVAVLELTDYVSGGALSPDETYVVRDSDVKPSRDHVPTVNLDKQPMHSSFDRCEPSILAFRDRQAAVAFVSDHGGQVMKFTDLASDYRR